MRKRQADRLIAAVFGITAFALSLGAKAVSAWFHSVFFARAHIACVLVSCLTFTALVLEYALSNHVHKGFRYFWQYRKVKNRLEKQMLDAGFGIQRSYYIELPKVSLSFDNTLSTGTLRIRNTVKFDKKLDDAMLSAALGRYVVEGHHVADDGNSYVYDLVDASVSFKLIFESYDEFLEYTQTISAFELFLDKRSTVKLQHSLLAGQTGSGKSVMLLILVLQMVTKSVPYQLFFADPKGSAHSVLGGILAPERTAVAVTDIVALLEKFVSLMEQRKHEMQELLKDDLTGDYTSFGLTPFVFLFEEFGAFSSVLSGEDKKIRDRVKSALYQVILEGRQLGFFMFIICQQPSAQTIDTALRENLPLKILLNPTEQQTITTTFGPGVDVPNRRYLVGEGVFTAPVVAPTPRLLQCSFCKFDIISVMNRGGVTTPVPDPKYERKEEHHHA